MRTASIPNFIEICGREIEFTYRPAIRSELPALVFLHEGLGSTALWRDFPKRIGERTGCGVLVYSRYGNGFSSAIETPRTQHYMHEEALETLPALLDRFDISQAVFVGHSDGASIALIFAGAYPDRTIALVLEAPHVYVEERSVESIAAIGERYRERGLRERMARHHRDVDATFESWNRIWLAPEFRAWNIESSLENLEVPVLCIQGENDEYGTLEQIDTIAARNPARTDRLILAACGHSPHRDRPAIVEDAVAGWLAESVPGVRANRRDVPDSVPPADRR